MEFNLNPVEIRILGSLIEKQMTTPDTYPLTLNSLVNACNQKSNREPVMELDAETVERALDRLRADQLVWQVKTQGSRALKYEHNMHKVADFSTRQLSVLCMLLLRGPQTAGELRSRTARMTEFNALQAVEHTLQKLADHENGSFVVKLSRRPGHKESRYIHLFSPLAPSDTVVDAVDGVDAGELDLAADAGSEISDPGESALPRDRVEPVERIRPPEPEEQELRIEALEKRVEELYVELNALKEEFLEFKGSFE